MILFAIEQAPFSFGAIELLFTGTAVAIILAILGPRYLRQRREKAAAPQP